MFTYVMAQLTSSTDESESLRKARRAAEQAKEKYACDMLIFPEYFMSYYPAHTPPAVLAAAAQPLDGPFVCEMQKLAQETGLWLVFSINESYSDSQVYNTTLVVNDQGQRVAYYRKSHLYDAFRYRESDLYAKGDALFQPIDTPFGKLGLMVCYDIRFPEVARYQALHGAQVLLAPSGFVRGDRKITHWETLLRARAIENGLFVIAANHISDKVFLGHSAAFDPNGDVLAIGSDTEEELIPVSVDLSLVSQARDACPCLKNRRPELYEI